MQVEWLESALLQFEAIVTHIADDKPTAAMKFRDAVNEKVLALAASRQWAEGRIAFKAKTFASSFYPKTISSSMQKRHKARSACIELRNCSPIPHRKHTISM